MQRVGRALRRFWSAIRGRESLVFAAHVALVLGVLSVVRPIFMTLVPAKVYHQKVIVWAMIQSDLTVISRWFAGRSAWPTLLFIVGPTVVLLALRRRLRWTDFDHGEKIRALLLPIVGILTWAGATFDYNSYLDQGHFVDRALLVALAVASWFTPITLPFFAKWAVVMLKEPYIPIIQDDFDLRSAAELLIVFSCFLWAAGLFRSFRAKHGLFAVVGCWASYYFAAGVAKMNVGPEWWSWTLTDHVSNISFGSHVRGWLSFLPDEVYLSALAQARRLDLVFTGYTMVLELGALFAFFVHPRLARWTFLGCFFLHFGIFTLTGICFWKWMFVNLVFFFWIPKKGALLYRQMTRAPLLVIFSIAMVFFSRGRTYYFPQTGVAWYDSRLVENYVFYVVGKSGKRYFLDPSYLTPMDIQWIQGRLCYATREHSVTGIYGVTRNYPAMLKLEVLEKPGDAMALVERGRRCEDDKQRAVFDEFFVRYFGTINAKGRQHEWLNRIGRPRHLYVFPKGENKYDTQEPITRLELWREVIVLQADKMHKLETKLTHTVDIPQ